MESTQSLLTIRQVLHEILIMSPGEFAMQQVKHLIILIIIAHKDIKG